MLTWLDNIVTPKLNNESDFIFEVSIVPARIIHYYPGYFFGKHKDITNVRTNVRTNLFKNYSLIINLETCEDGDGTLIMFSSM